MFQLYDQTRRRIALFAFFLLCVAPTAAVTAWCIAWQLPGHLQAETERLGRQLGLDVSLDRMQHLRPGLVVYEGLKLSDPETGQVVLRCRAVEATWTSMMDPQGRRRPAVVLVASQPEIEAAAANRLWRVVERTLQGENGGPQMELRVSAGELTFSAGENSQTLSDVEGGIGILPFGVQVEATFRLAGSTATGPVHVRMVRNRQVTPPANGFDLDTAGTELPCHLLSLGLPGLRSLGPVSRFRGSLWAHQTADGWDGESSGQLSGVDLDSLVSGHFPHKLSGPADIAFQRARFHRGRLEEVTATFTAGPGVIGRSLVGAAEAHLRLLPDAGNTAAGDLLPYEQLAMAFAIDSHGLRLEGRCAKAGAGTVLADRRGRLLGSSATGPQPIAALIRTLVPANETHVPATRQTDWLARHLPVPDVLPPAHARADLSPSQLRLRKKTER